MRHPSFLWVLRHNPSVAWGMFIQPLVYCVIVLLALNYIDTEYGSTASNLTAGGMLIIVLAVLNRRSS